MNISNSYDKCLQWKFFSNNPFKTEEIECKKIKALLGK